MIGCATRLSGVSREHQVYRSAYVFTMLKAQHVVLYTTKQVLKLLLKSGSAFKNNLLLTFVLLTEHYLVMTSSIFYKYQTCEKICPNEKFFVCFSKKWVFTSYQHKNVDMKIIPPAVPSFHGQKCPMVYFFPPHYDTSFPFVFHCKIRNNNKKKIFASEFRVPRWRIQHGVRFNNLRKVKLCGIWGFSKALITSLPTDYYSEIRVSKFKNGESNMADEFFKIPTQ